MFRTGRFCPFRIFRGFVQEATWLLPGAVSEWGRHLESPVVSVLAEDSPGAEPEWAVPTGQRRRGKTTERRPMKGAVRCTLLQTDFTRRIEEEVGVNLPLLEACF